MSGRKTNLNRYIVFLERLQETTEIFISFGAEGTWRCTIPVEIWIKRQKRRLRDSSCWHPNGCHRLWTTSTCSCSTEISGLIQSMKWIPYVAPLPHCLECGEFGGLPKKGSWLCMFCDSERWNGEVLFNIEELLRIFKRNLNCLRQKYEPRKASQELRLAWQDLKQHGGCERVVDQTKLVLFDARIRGLENICSSSSGKKRDIANMELTALKSQRELAVQSIRSFENCDESCEFHVAYLRALKKVERISKRSPYLHLYVPSSDLLNHAIIQLICMGQKQQ